MEKENKNISKKNTAISIIQTLFSTLIKSVEQYSYYVGFINYIKDSLNIKDNEEPYVNLEPEQKNNMMNIVNGLLTTLTELKILVCSMSKKLNLEEEDKKEIKKQYDTIRDSLIPSRDVIESFLENIQSKIFDSVIGTILEDNTDLYNKTYA